jgi:hypothetical protein
MNSLQPSPLVLVAQNPPFAGQTFVIQPGINTLGRDPAHDIRLPDDSISRNHARIVAQPEGTWIEDLGSTNGTFVNGQRVTDGTHLRPGDVIQLGNAVTLSVQPDRSGLDDEATLLPAAGFGDPNQTLAPDTLPPPVVRPVSAPPQAPGVQPVYPPPPQAQGRGPGFWIGVTALITVVIIAAILVGLYFFLLASQTGTPTPPSQPTTADQLSVVTGLESPTPSPPPSNTPTLSPSPELSVLPYGAMAALLAEEGDEPQDIGNRVDPFCEGQIEVKASEPVLISWEQRLVADDETDYVAQWLEAVYFDIRLDGTPVTELGRSLNYSRAESCEDNAPCAYILNWWINLGLLETKDYHLTLDWYANRAISSGLDLEPADGELDTFGPGQVDRGGGSCDILVVAVSTPTPRGARATPTPAKTATPKPTPAPTRRPATATPASFPLGVFQDFETQSTWKRGDQPYGQLNRSTDQAHGGSYSGRLTYDIPNVGDASDFVVFLQTRRLAGQPNAIMAWVYGDNSGNYLNVWLRGAAGQVWQMPLGRIQHSGWRQMTALLDPNGDWPVAHVQGPNDGAINYPISFHGLVLDHIPSASSRGAIFIDDLSSQAGASPPTAVPAGQGQPTPVGPTSFSMRIGQHRYEEWGYADDPCASHFNDDIHMRGLNLEILLTNNASSKITDHWLPTFTTAQGKEVKACPHYYGGSGPPPGATSSVTFFMLVTPDDHVRTVRLTINNDTVRVCLDHNGAQTGC